ncbi:MAG: 1-(5-phosphoribosyl)-5-[(5-phosphoribosylamino)methylideneamino]imidazole-4-carboxamide isomerase [Planctomycetaceae bacterium]|jgi:phosphoribosylformimino-5-aminoimidazole carboxamide ribotide isomerase|nr:1-(5-phosphoribosyl)-5-[(5-phosphoribosylamino)methylideneamino]imidazole-4-carboxamide isomerase [Planctomycetaceae bacterium]
MQILPAIDILNGKCVRLKQGDYLLETQYSEDPLEVARRWSLLGAEMLHVVDLDGAKGKRPMNFDLVVSIAKAVKIPVEVGGGIRNELAIRDYLLAGVERVVVGTLALTDPDWFRQMVMLYPHRLVLGIDARGGRVAVEGWSETSGVGAVELARQFAELPLAAIVYTDIAKDGMLEGPNFDEIATIQNAIPLPIIASGGISTLEDVKKLKSLNIPACIIGKALYEEKIKLNDAIKIAKNSK